MQYLSRLNAVFFIAMMLLGCSTEAPVSADLAGNGTTLAKKGHDDDDCGCGKIKAKLLATGQINPPLLIATGEMRGDLKGTVNYVAYLADIVPLISSAGNDPVNPTASLLGTWTLTTKNGVLTFRDVGTFEQVPNGIGTSFSTVIGGTGCYSGASGFLFVSFVADETGLIFNEEHRGRIFCQKHNDDDGDEDD